MKALILSTILITGAVLPIVAEDIKVSIGGAGGIGLATGMTRMDGTFVTTDTWAESTLSSKLLFCGVFLDGTYVELESNIQTRLGNDHLKAVNYYLGATNTYESDPVSQTLTFDLISSMYLKYPISFGNVNVFPLGGIRYLAVLVNSSFKNLTTDQKASFNDFYLAGGAGVDWLLGGSAYFRSLGVFSYDLNPDTKLLELNAKAFGSSYKATIYRLDLSFAFGLYL